jgi:hypothetical protein
MKNIIFFIALLSFFMTNAHFPTKTGGQPGTITKTL